MSIRLIASLVIAALLFTGAGISVPGRTDSNAAAITPNTTTKTVAALSEEDAKTIALEHAGLQAEDVTGIRVEVDRDDGRRELEVEFRAGDMEFDYTIDAETGKILERDKDHDPVDPKPTEPPVTPPPATELTKEAAIAIALDHAGLTEAEVTRLKAEFDRDDRTPEWEVEFNSGDHEFDYTIHAVTGQILKWDKEYDPPKAKETKPTEPPVTKPTPEKLTREAAIAAALEHAGLTEADVTRLKAEFDQDDRTPEWEVEFRVGRMEYEYTIHAETGAILEWDKEIDD